MTLSHVWFLVLEHATLKFLTGNLHWILEDQNHRISPQKHLANETILESLGGDYKQ